MVRGGGCGRGIGIGIGMFFGENARNKKNK